MHCFRIGQKLPIEYYQAVIKREVFERGFENLETVVSLCNFGGY